MRILHTSDWHLGSRLRHIQRQPHIRDRLAEIAGYLDQHRVDVMVVAGDLFDKKHLHTDELRAVLVDVREAFQRYLVGGGTIVAISGNHDHEGLFSLLHATLDLAAPIDAADTGPRRPGRLYLAPRPGLLRLSDRTGQQVQFALLPYPTVTRYLDGEEASVASPEDRNLRLQRGLHERLERICAKLDPGLPSVLVAHTHVRGGRVHTLYELEHKDDVIFETAHLPAQFAYAAYGHIHLAQELAESARVRYSGSIERMSKDERGDHKGVVLVEVGGGACSVPEVLPLRATPMVCRSLRDPEADLRALGEEYPDPETILYYTLDVPQEQDREAVHQDVRRRYRNAIREMLAPTEISGPDAATAAASPPLSAQVRDLRGTVAAFLSEQLADYSGKERALAVVNELIDKLEAAPSALPA